MSHQTSLSKQPLHFTASSLAYVRLCASKRLVIASKCFHLYLKKGLKKEKDIDSVLLLTIRIILSEQTATRRQLNQ